MASTLKLDHQNKLQIVPDIYSASLEEAQKMLILRV